MDFRGAIPNYDKALTYDHSYVDALTGRAHAFLALGDYKYAERDYDRCVLLIQSPDAYVNRGDFYKVTGRLSLAYADYKQAALKDGIYAQKLLELGHLQLMRKDRQRALLSFEGASAADSKLVAALIASARIYLEDRRFKEAISKADAALRIAASNAEAVRIKRKALDAMHERARRYR